MTALEPIGGGVQVLRLAGLDVDIDQRRVITALVEHEHARRGERELLHAPPAELLAKLEARARRGEGRIRRRRARRRQAVAQDRREACDDVLVVVGVLLGELALLPRDVDVEEQLRRVDVSRRAEQLGRVPGSAAAHPVVELADPVTEHGDRDLHGLQHAAAARGRRGRAKHLREPRDDLRAGGARRRCEHQLAKPGPAASRRELGDADDERRAGIAVELGLDVGPVAAWLVERRGRRGLLVRVDLRDRERDPDPRRRGLAAHQRTAAGRSCPCRCRCRCSPSRPRWPAPASLAASWRRCRRWRRVRGRGRWRGGALGFRTEPRGVSRRGSPAAACAHAEHVVYLSSTLTPGVPAQLAETLRGYLSTVVTELEAGPCRDAAG